MFGGVFCQCFFLFFCLFVFCVCGVFFIGFFFFLFFFSLWSVYIVSGDWGARCSSVVRAFAHGAMGRRFDPSWGGPIELFLVPASAPRLV